MTDWAGRLARRRVPLGFATAILVLLLATPTPATLVAGALVAVAGEALRIWAAGHLEKSREVTTSGPYRFTRHPLYVGSGIIAAGAVIASASIAAAIIALLYFIGTVTAAVRTEEAFLRAKFGPEYDRYCAGAADTAARRFSWDRVRKNRESRALRGLLLAFALLTAKFLWLV